MASSQFNGKVVLMTGAASGIGRATAIRLRARGRRLSLSDINAGRLVQGGREVEALRARGLNLTGVSFDGLLDLRRRPPQHAPRPCVLCRLPAQELPELETAAAVGACAGGVIANSVRRAPSRPAPSSRQRIAPGV